MPLGHWDTNPAVKHAAVRDSGRGLWLILARHTWAGQRVVQLNQTQALLEYKELTPSRQSHGGGGGS